MKRIDISSLFAETKKQIISRSPEILTGLGIAGMIFSTITAVKATPKAIRLLDDEKKKKEDALTVKETIQTTWKCYVVPAVSGVSGVACIIFAARQRNARGAAFAAAYTLTETAFNEYRSKALEKLGEKKEEEIRDSIARDKVLNNPPVERDIIITDSGNTLCYDAITGRYFKSSIDDLKKIENVLNLRLRDEMYVSLNELYYEIGLPSVEIGDDLGWHVDNGYVSLKFSAQLTENDVPCIVVSYDIAPYYGYDS